MSAPWWTDYPKKSWVEVDWQAWEKAGRPRVPPDMELESAPEQEMGNSPVIPPPGPQPSFRLFAKPRRREAVSARSRAVDQWLEKHVGR